MSQETPIVLYMGDKETGQWLDLMLSPLGGYVYVRDDLLPALGIYVNYQPDVVILDAWTKPDLARTAYFHLRTVDATNIVILDDKIEDWEIPADAQIQVLTSKSDLFSAITELIGISFVICEGLTDR